MAIRLTQHQYENLDTFLNSIEFMDPDQMFIKKGQELMSCKDICNVVGIKPTRTNVCIVSRIIRERFKDARNKVCRNEQGVIGRHYLVQNNDARTIESMRVMKGMA